MKLRQAITNPKEDNQRSKSGQQECQSFSRSMEDIALLKLKNNFQVY